MWLYGLGASPSVLCYLDSSKVEVTAVAHHFHLNGFSFHARSFTTLLGMKSLGMNVSSWTPR